MRPEDQTIRNPKGHLYTKEDLEVLTGHNVLVIDQTPGLSWEKDYNSFYLDASRVPVQWERGYDILNPLTGVMRNYEFAEKLGDTYDPRCELVFVDHEGIELHLFNLGGAFGADPIYAQSYL